MKNAIGCIMGNMRALPVLRHKSQDISTCAALIFNFFLLNLALTSLSTSWKCNAESLVYSFDISPYLVDILKQNVFGFSKIMRPFKLQTTHFRMNQKCLLNHH